MARSGVRPQFARKASDDWALSKKNGASASAPDAPSPDVADPPPSVLGIPIDQLGIPIDQYVNVDQQMPTIAEDGEADPVIDGSAIDHAAIHRALREVGPGAIFGSGELPAASARAPQLQLGPVDDPSIDQLWDWVRADHDGMMKFLGFIPDTSRFLFKWIENFQILEGDAAAWMRAIYIAGKLSGFVMLCPVKPSGTGTYVGDCHLYLSQAARGNVKTLLPLLTAELDRLIPNVSLRVVTARDDEWARVLRSVGFTTQIVLTRPAASTGSPSGT